MNFNHWLSLNVCCRGQNWWEQNVVINENLAYNIFFPLNPFYFPFFIFSFFFLTAMIVVLFSSLNYIYFRVVGDQRIVANWQWYSFPSTIGDPNFFFTSYMESRMFQVYRLDAFMRITDAVAAAASVAFAHQ